MLSYAFTSIITVVLCFQASAFTAISPASALQRVTSSTKLFVSSYVPSGLTAEEYKKIREKDMQKLKGKNLGQVGPRGFKSRSMQAWQEAFERGETGHTFAAIGYKEKLKQGLMRWEDVPYMIRGGSWDNSDVAFARNRLRWSKTDREYARGGYKKEQSVSILGSGPGFDWTGTRSREENSKRSLPGLF